MRTSRTPHRIRSLTALTLAILALCGSAETAAAAAPPVDETIEIQLLGINDFHGRLEADPQRGMAGAAVLAGAVRELRAQNPNTVFASAGDNVGGTPFASFIAQDEPTIRALVAAGLEVSSVGNHEFDQGYRDLIDRIVPSYGTPNLALGANVRLKTTGDAALPEYAVVERSGVKIGFIGLVTEHTETSVTAAHVQDLVFADQLQTAIDVADHIADDVDVTVVLTHDGSFSQDCASIATESSGFGELVRGLTGKVDAIVSGHSHTAYACTIDGLPVVSAGFYGTALSQVTMSVDVATREVRNARAALIPLVTNGAAAFVPDPLVADLVADAVAAAEHQGAQPIGRISASILRGGTPSGSDRGVESSLGNLIADIMHAKVPDADVAIVNPGSLRADLLFLDDGTLAYRDVASVQPFGNTLIAMTLTGAQLRQVLEAQWYLDGGIALKRHLALSEGLSYTFAPDAAPGTRVGELTLQGRVLYGTDAVRIVTNGFLAGGGDGFETFTHGTNQVDTGYNDLQATVEHFASNTVVNPPSTGRAIAEHAPQPEPTTVPTPEPTSAPTPDATTPPSGAAAPKHLATTGASHNALGGATFSVAVGLIASGTFLLVALRRHKNKPRPAHPTRSVA